MKILEKIDNYLLEGVAETILKQIKQLDKFALQAWGAKNFVSSKDGIHFDVRGTKHRGKVVIKLKNDLYDIEIGTVRKLEYKPKKKVRGIGVEQLVSTVDSLIG